MDKEAFRYLGYEVDHAASRVVCHYSLAGRPFTEEITFEVPGWGNGGGGQADGGEENGGEENGGEENGGEENGGEENGGEEKRASDQIPGAIDAAARIVHLLAGVSYYKTAAPPVVDLGDIATTAQERRFLRMFYVEGLGEFAFRHGIDLGALRIVGPHLDGRAPVASPPTRRGPLVPFGAGIDSIVTLESVRKHHPATSLFVVGRGGRRFDAIEQAAEVTGLPVVRAERSLDTALTGPDAGAFLNGHVPVTGILSAIAIVAAVAGGYDAVVMANERSASVPTIDHDGHPVNHQWSKSLAFEEGFRALLASTFQEPPAYFSFLRSRTELWVAERFASLERYHHVFRSCNRAFAADPAKRLDHWCGRCDKCCFIDLVLAPYMPASTLSSIFDGREPLHEVSLEPSFRALLGIGTGRKPFECVGDESECRTAASLAAQRSDRRTCSMLHRLAEDARGAASSMGLAAEHLVGPEGASLDFVPARYATDSSGTAPVAPACDGW